MHCLPLAAQIRARLPEAKITWLVEPPARALLQGNEAVDQVIVFEKKDLVAQLKNPLSLGTGISKIQDLATTLSANQFDLAIDAQGLLKSALLAWCSKAPVRVGFKGAREGSGLFMTDTLDVGDYWGLTRHIVDHNIALADFAIETLARRKNLVPLGRPELVKFPLPIPQAIVRQEVEALMVGGELPPKSDPSTDLQPAPLLAPVPPLGSVPPAKPAPPAVHAPPLPLQSMPAPPTELGLAFQPVSIKLNCPIAVLIPGTTWQTKIWPADKWIELGAALINSGVGRLIICGGKAEEGTNRSIYIGIESLVGQKGLTVDLTAKTDLMQLVSLFEMSDLVVGADSGPTHLAAAVARPLVVAVHGSTPWLRNGPYGEKGRAVYAGIACQPCFSKTCALKTIECLRDLPVDKVLQAIAQSNLSM